MADFTPAELAYIELLQTLKAEMPHKDVSIFNHVITTREDLLNTILAYQAPLKNFRTATKYKFAPGSWGIRADFYDQYGNTYEFWKLPNEKSFSDLLCTSIVNYIPRLKLPEASTLVSTTEGNMAEFLHHYDMSIRRLLDGPPHANKHFINKKLAAQWVSLQKTPERKRLAQLLIDKTRYIPHRELLQKIEECVEKAKEKLVDGPVTFIVATKDKSNYYVSLLFYHFWIKAGLRLDAVKTHMDGLVEGNLIDIDEMAYSGSQTTKTLASVFNPIVLNIHKQLILLNASTEDPTKYVPSYSKSKIFLPVPLIETILYKNKINYIVVRVFCSEKGEKALLQMPPIDFGFGASPIKPPFDLIVGEIIPSPTTLFGYEDALKLGFMFGSPKGYPAAPVYFNHKVADRPSTYLNPYAYGVIPDKLLLQDPLDEGGPYLFTPAEQAIYNSLETPPSDTNTTSFLPFIEYCQKELRPMPSSRKNIIKYERPGQVERMGDSFNLPQVFRCPYAWYKNINYDTGKYTPPPGVRGGTRRVKRKSTKHRFTRR